MTYRVQMVVYDVLDLVVDLPPATPHQMIVAAAIEAAERDHPLVAWQVDEETVEVIPWPSRGRGPAG